MLSHRKCEPFLTKQYMILIHYVCNAHFHLLWRRKFSALKSLRLCHESNDDVTSLTTRRSKRVLSEWIRMVITRFVLEWFAGINCIIYGRKYPFYRDASATVKWYNLCLQIIQLQTCYPPINFITVICHFFMLRPEKSAGASSNWIVCPSDCLSLCLSVRNSVPLTKCNI